MDWPPVMEWLVQGIEDETRMSGSARPPADDAAGERVDHESDVNEALPSGYIREIGKPQHVRRGSAELAVHAVERT